MKNANKSPEIAYSTMVGKWKSDPESISGTLSSPTVNHFIRFESPIITPNFNEIG